MGMIFEDNDQDIHAEAKTESFCLFSDYGKDWSIELHWHQLDELKRLVGDLHEYATEHGYVTYPETLGEGI